MTGHGVDRALQAVEAFAHHLVVALVNLEMHGVGSALIDENIETLQLDLHDLAAAQQSQALCLQTLDNRVHWRGRPLEQASLQAGRLLRLCRERNIRSLEFELDVSARELRAFVVLLSDRQQRAAFTPEVLPRVLEREGLRGIRVQLIADIPSDAPSSLLGGGVDHALRQYQAMADVLYDSHVAAHRGHSLELDSAFTAIESTIGTMNPEASELLGLAMNDVIDQFTIGHSVRVTLLALHTAQALGASSEDLMRVGTAALLHDIGKSRVPQKILFKAGLLDPEEQRVMMMHARWGGELLLENGNVETTTIGAAFCHHMGPHGIGYPSRAPGFEPGGIAKLVRVCDVFEALTAARPYKAALNPAHAFVLMNRMADGFDPAWLNFFMRCVGIFPVGSKVELEDGSVARVIAPGPSLLQPRVELLDAAVDAPRTCTIGETIDGVTHRIARVVGTGEPLAIPRHCLHDGESCACILPHVMTAPIET